MKRARLQNSAKNRRLEQTQRTTGFLRNISAKTPKEQIELIEKAIRKTPERRTRKPSQSQETNFSICRPIYQSVFFRRSTNVDQRHERYYFVTILPHDESCYYFQIYVIWIQSE